MLQSSLMGNLEFSVRYAVFAALVWLVCWVLANGLFTDRNARLAATTLLTVIALFVLFSYL